MPEPITNTGYKLPEGCFNYMDLSKYNSSRKKDEDMIRHIRECGECSERLKTIKTARSLAGSVEKFSLDHKISGRPLDWLIKQHGYPIHELDLKDLFVKDEDLTKGLD